MVSCLLAGCSQEDPDDTKTERFVIENRTQSPASAEIEVLEEGSVVLTGCYSCPPDAELKFPHAFPWGEYTIRGRLDGGDWLERPWNPRSCAPTPHEDGNMHAGLVITDAGTPELVINGCDYSKLGGHYIEQYHSPSEYKQSC